MSTKRTYTGKYYLRKKARTAGANGLITTSKINRTKPKGQMWPYSSPFSYLNVWDPFPAKQVARMRYSESIAITPTTGAADVYTFAANGIYDPNVTGTGHQPYGHDTYANIYNTYRVIKSTCVVRCVSNTNCIYGVNIANQSGPITDFDLIKERKGCKMNVYNSNGPSEAVTQCYTEKLVGVLNPVSADFGSSPNDLWYYNVWCTMPTSSDTGAERDFIVDITYDVLMWNMKSLSKS